MDYQQLNSLMARKGIISDPAFKDVNVAIEPLPTEYNFALGLYYPDEEFIVLPPDASEDVALHELGHRHHHFYNNNLSEWLAEDYRMKYKALMSTPYTGQYSRITGIECPSTASAGQTVNFSVTVENIWTGNLRLMTSGVVENNNRFLDYDIQLQPGESRRLTGTFIMLSQATVVNLYVQYLGSDQNFHDDINNCRTTINESGSYQIPSNYTLDQYIFYPDSVRYRGEMVESCTFQFNAPLTIIPGVKWLADKMLSAYVSSCVQNGAIPIELKIYSKSGDWGSTDYIVQATAAPKAATYRNPATALPVIAWVAIIPVCLAIMAVGLAFVIMQMTNYRYGPEQTTTTTTQPQSGTVGPNQSLAVSSGAATVKVGASGGVVTDSLGNSRNILPNTTVVLGQGDTYLDGGAGSLYETAAQTTITKSPSNPKGEDTISNTIKWVAIGGIVLVVALVGIAALQAFGKREVYPMRA